MTEPHTIFTACESTGVRDDDRAAWLKARSALVTASDMVAILGLSPSRDIVDVFVDKLRPQTEPEKLGLDDPRFWGSVLEQPILSALSAYHGWAYRRGGYLLRSKEFPILGCTLDGELYRHPDEGWINYEGKTTRFPSGWSQDDGEVPDKVLIQVQTQLIVTCAPASLTFGLLQGCRPVQVTVHPSDTLQDVIIEEAERFWDLVQRAEIPKVTHKSGAALQRWFEADNGATVLLPEESAAWTRELFALKKQAKDIEARIDALGNELKKCIGEAKFGQLPEPIDGKSRWKWAAPSNRSSRTLLAMK